jgi:hypothetical protein
MSSSFRRSVQAETSKKKGGKGGRGNWRERMKLPQEAPTAFIIQSHEFLDKHPPSDMIEIDPTTGQPLPVKNPYYKYIKHTRKVAAGPGKNPFYREQPCSAGDDPHNPQPCVGCMAMDRQDPSVKRGDSYNVGIVHLALYHKVPAIDPEKGQLKRKDGSDILNDYECLGADCNYCRVLRGEAPVLKGNEFFPQLHPQSIQTVFGGRRYLEVGSGHLGDLGSWMKQVEMKCGGTRQAKDPQGTPYLTRCNSQLTVDGYTCSTCNSPVVDKQHVPPTPEGREEILGKKVACYNCKRPTFVKPHYACSVCGNAVVNSLFDGVAWGMRQGEGTNSHMTLVQFDTLEDFDNTIPPQYKALLGTTSLKDRIAELNVQYDFEAMNQPKSLDEQAKAFGYDLKQLMGNQGGYSAPQQQFQPYGTPPAQQQAPQAPSAPQYQPYGAPQAPGPQYQTPQGPGPIPFIPPTKPNFGN